MYLTGTVLRGVLMVLLLANSCDVRRCNYKEILRSYTGVIFVELQKLNMTDPPNTSKERDPCRSGKARHILVSILRMTQQMRWCWGGKQMLHIDLPLEHMEQLIIHNCSRDYLGSKVSCSSVKKIKGKKRKRIRLMRVIEALITCWQKLQSVYKHSI